MNFVYYASFSITALNRINPRWYRYKISGAKNNQKPLKEAIIDRATLDNLFPTSLKFRIPDSLPIAILSVSNHREVCILVEA
jgi:hypothetical protein